MAENNVIKLYSIGKAKWYDFFKKIWNKIFSSKAEEQLSVFLKKNLTENTRILELGCGTALNLKKIFDLNLKFKNYLGLDFSPDMLKIARNRFPGVTKVKFIQRDITTLNDFNEKFDIIICTWVLSHLRNPEELVNKAQNLLSEHGKAFFVFLTVPKWYARFWLCPVAKYLFSARCISEQTVAKFNNIKTKHRFSANITTAIEI